MAVAGVTQQLGRHQLLACAYPAVTSVQQENTRQGRLGKAWVVGSVVLCRQPHFNTAETIRPMQCHTQHLLQYNSTHCPQRSLQTIPAPTHSKGSEAKRSSFVVSWTVLQLIRCSTSNNGVHHSCPCVYNQPRPIYTTDPAHPNQAHLRSLRHPVEPVDSSYSYIQLHQMTAFNRTPIWYKQHCA